jgi:two-component system, cell cycle sensor histidine kinase and response regulator CckA
MTPEAFLVFARALPEPMALVGVDGTVLAANPACTDFPLLSIVPGASLHALVQFPDRFRSYLAACFASQTIVRSRLAMLAPDGRTLDVRCEGVGMPGENGDVEVVLLRLRSRESAAREVALQAAEARYRAMVENAVHGICRCRVDGIVLDANPALAQLLGASSVEGLIGVSLPDEVYDDPVAFLTLVDRVRHAGRVLSADANWTRGDETAIAVRVSGRFESTEPGGAEILELLVEDATERRSLEAQLAQAQKMESVGRLAGGIAHDFNNLLTAILGYVDLMQGTLAAGDPISRHAQQIRKAADRASMLTRQLLAFSRKQILQPRVLDLNGVVEDSTQMLRRLISENIDLVTRLDPALLRVRVDPSQLQQVLLNLAVNARDAMPRGGTLAIVTGNVTLLAGALGRNPEVEPGPYVMLTVEDSGVGMDATTRARIFEPFFTTKRVGEGTGLGLSTVYGIVRQSGGHIVVESEPTHGSRFTIYLPAVAEAVDPPRPDNVLTEGPIGSETLLLVEDDAMVRMLAVEALRLKGYRVIEASDGREALLAAQQHRTAIDLVITDVVMPRMTGRELAERLTSSSPQMRVLFMSGYPGSLIDQHGLLERGFDLLEKPFTPGTLITRVRQALDRPASSARANRAGGRNSG